MTRPTLTPTRAYARCRECGTDAGEPCYDSHDRPCAPCAGRVLASAGAERREALSRAQRPTPPPRASRAAPLARRHCARCGAAVKSSATWCVSLPCQSQKKRVRRAEATAARGDRVCCECSSPIVQGRYCSVAACQCERIRMRRTPPDGARDDGPRCPGCHAPQSHSRHCNDLCARISDLYLRARSRIAKPPEKKHHDSA